MESNTKEIYFYEAYDHHGFLSNFYTRMTVPYQQTKTEEEFDATFDESKLIPIVYEGILFANSEQAFCYAKAKALGYGQDVLDVIIATKNPHTIKEIGSGAKRIVGVSIGETIDWTTAQWGANETGPIMYGILLSKFGDTYMASLLKGTGNAMLVEAAPGDSNWGIGFSEDAAPDNKKSWGKNRLGMTLMKVRDALA
jgi:ribA/ribD-fused uncharacterized protein